MAQGQFHAGLLLISPSHWNWCCRVEHDCVYGEAGSKGCNAGDEGLATLSCDRQPLDGVREYIQREQAATGQCYQYHD